MIGNKIKELREKRKISPRDLADRLDIDLSTLNRIENNKIGTFKPDFLLKITEELGSNIAELFDQNANIAIQHNEQGQNINVLNQQKDETLLDDEAIWKKIAYAKDETILALKGVSQSQEILNTYLRSRVEALEERLEEANGRL